MTATNSRVNMTDLHDTIAAQPPVEAVKAMFKDWRVLVAAMFCGTLVLLALLAVVGFLAYSGRSTEAVMVIMTAIIVPILSAVLSKLNTVQHHVNGNTSRLLDAAVGPARSSSPTPPADTGESIR